MSIFVTVASIRAVLRLKRTCPKCKRNQIVPASKRWKSVRCKFCRAVIPPLK